MCYKIGNTFVNNHSNVNILLPKRKSLKEMYLYGDDSNNYWVIKVNTGQTINDVLFVKFSCHRIFST